MLRWLKTQSIQTSVFLNPNMTLKNRLQLLSEAEIEELYGRPDFNTAEWELYFTMSQQEMDELRQYSATKTRVAYILQLD